MDGRAETKASGVIELVSASLGASAHIVQWDVHLRGKRMHL